MSVTRRDIEKIAALAELGVDDATAAELEKQLTRILDYVAQLSEVTDDAISATDERAVRLRRDVVNPDPLSRTPQEIAPAFTDGLFTVPRLGELDRGEDAP
ncbi:MAG TPA: Asp-tRNA(Asn)/Glu-tRNA(Gln) amidotransferase subunit GatC [Gemmatimonadales bacterium]|nr:Asp-tRNA(Asn)/Glu-tRNA(Gln) amidotransferase subunit GatC [Gemmatimonadales bacterium]